MSTPSTKSVLWDAPKAMFDLFLAADSLAGVSISPVDPGDEIAAETVWLDTLVASSDVTEFGYSREIRDETITATVMVRVTGVVQDEDCWDRLMQIVAALKEVLVLFKDLDDSPGVWSAIATDTRATVLTTPADGAIGWAELTVEIKTQLS